MTGPEMTMLVRYVRAMFPAQKFDEYTADAWTDVIGDLRLVDCKLAVVEIAGKQQWVAVFDIKGWVRAIRNNRIMHGPEYEPSSGLSELEWRRRLADGEHVPAPVGLKPRPVTLAIANTFRKVPNA